VVEIGMVTRHDIALDVLPDIHEILDAEEGRSGL
jgi:hypothetical protein